MNGYIEKAIRTESIVGAEDRLQNVFNLLGILNEELVNTVEVTADELKKYIYYGKPAKITRIDETRVLEPRVDISVDTIRLLHVGLGLLTEAQEFLKPVIDSLLQSKCVDKVNLKEELGDLFWYSAIACDTLQTTFEAEQNRNIAKLSKRYPEKFYIDLAINRDISAEREILESEFK